MQLIYETEQKQGDIFRTGDSMLHCVITMRNHFSDLPQYLTQRVDGHIKGTTDWSEMTGRGNLFVEMGKRRTGKR